MEHIYNMHDVRRIANDDAAFEALGTEINELKSRLRKQRGWTKDARRLSMLNQLATDVADVRLENFSKEVACQES